MAASAAALAWRARGTRLCQVAAREGWFLEKRGEVIIGLGFITMFGSSIEIHKSRRAFPQAVGLKKGSFPADLTSAIAC